MIDLKVIHANAKEIKNKLSLTTFPLAIKMAKDENDIPKNAIRPFRDKGYHLDNCQAFSMSRRSQKTVAMTKEDMWCMAPHIAFGFVKPSEEWLKGKHRGLLGENPEAREKAVQSAPRFKVGEYMGIISAPLEQCSFEPDLFIIYCDPYQLTHILVAKDCIDGEDITSTFAGHCSCLRAVVPVLQNRKCWIVSPGRGDRQNALTQNNEMIFSAPIEILEDFVKAFRYLEEHGQHIPFDLYFHPERKPEIGIYTDIGRTMRINIGTKDLPYKGIV